MKIKLSSHILQEIAADGKLDEIEKQWISSQFAANPSCDGINTDIKNIPHGLLKAILDDGRITPNQRVQISFQLYRTKERVSLKDINPTEIFDTFVSSPSEMGAELMKLDKEYNCEIKLKDRWYLSSFSLSTSGRDKTLTITINLRICDTTENMYAMISRNWFRDGVGQKNTA